MEEGRIEMGEVAAAIMLYSTSPFSILPFPIKAFFRVPRQFSGR